MDRSKRIRFWLVSLVSFVLALGALIVARRAGSDPAVQTLGAPLLAPTHAT